MNISSVIVNCSGSVSTIESEISKLDGVEIKANKDEKIVAVLTSANLDDEIAKFRAIERIKGVKNVVMVYSYQELDSDIERANLGGLEATMEKIAKQDIKDIKYSGDLKV